MKKSDRERQERQAVAINDELNSFLPVLVAEQDLCSLFSDSDLLEDADAGALEIIQQILDFYISLLKKNLLLNIHEYGENDSNTWKYFDEILGAISFSLGLNMQEYDALGDYVLENLEPYIDLPDQHYFYANGLIVPIYVN